MEFTKLHKYKIYFPNKEEYHIIKNEIFNTDDYHFNLKNPKPFIIDVGSHIGLSILYFKEMFPDCEILALEPNPVLFHVLEMNIFENGLTDVIAKQIAVGENNEEKEFFFKNSSNIWLSTGGFHKQGWDSNQEMASTKVSCTTLSSLIEKEVDLLKIDIEGWEEKVLKEACQKLHLVRNIVVEYHPRGDNSFSKIITMLENKDFRITLTQEGKDVKRYNGKGLVLIKGSKN